MSTVGSNPPSSSPVIEVERKFLCPPDIVERLERQGARQIASQSFTDSYYDDVTHTLTLADHWLRSRDGAWQLKSPPAERLDSHTTAQYLETDSAPQILQVLREPLRSCSHTLEDLITAHHLEVFAKFRTSRRRFELGGFLVVVDEADFGYQVGEVEKVVQKQEEMEGALLEVNDMVRALGEYPVEGVQVELYYRWSERT